MLNVSAKTVQSWEQGTRTPSHAALRLIEVLRKRPDVVLDVAGLTPLPPLRPRGRSR
jgi:putative transcriptional regulator